MYRSRYTRKPRFASTRAYGRTRSKSPYRRRSFARPNASRIAAFRKKRATSQIRRFAASAVARWRKHRPGTPFLSKRIYRPMPYIKKNECRVLNWSYSGSLAQSTLIQFKPSNIVMPLNGISCNYYQGVGELGADYAKYVVMRCEVMFKLTPAIADAYDIWVHGFSGTRTPTLGITANTMQQYPKSLGNRYGVIHGAAGLAISKPRCSVMKFVYFPRMTGFRDIVAAYNQPVITAGAVTTPAYPMFVGNLDGSNNAFQPAINWFNWFQFAYADPGASGTASTAQLEIQARAWVQVFRHDDVNLVNDGSNTGTTTYTTTVNEVDT